MEVLEHIEDIPGFLHIVRSNLGDEGLFLGSTPNARVLDTPDDPMLLAVLSPGWHVVLFSKQSLEKCLKDAGFKQVQVIEDGASLLVSASRKGQSVAFDKLPDTDLFVNYLSKRLAEVQDNPSLWSALAYRKYKVLVNSGNYTSAEAFYTDLKAGYQQRFAVDLDDPVATAQKLANPDAYTNGGVPFNVPNIYFYRGISLINTVGSGPAEPFFRANVFLADILNRFYLEYGVSDGETAHLQELAGPLLARCEQERIQSEAV